MKDDMLFWVRGLREPEEGKNHSLAWQQVLMDILNKGHFGLEQGTTTADSEEKLGKNSFIYWYVLRTEKVYGKVVFLCTTNQFESSNGFSCPFDTGGLLRNKINLSVDWSEAKRISFVHLHSKTVDTWESDFKTYLIENYGDGLGDYISGKPPRIGTPPIDCSELKSNDPKAWTWETRLNHSTASDAIKTAQVFISEQDKIDFYRWLESLDEFEISDKELEQITDLVEELFSEGVESEPFYSARKSLLELHR